MKKLPKIFLVIVGILLTLILSPGTIFAEVGVPSILEAAGDTTDATSWTTGSVTPTSGEIAFVTATYVSGGPDDWAIPTDTWGDTGGGSWAEIDGASQQGFLSHGLWYRLIGSSPSAGTITLATNGATGLNAAWAIFELNGADESALVSERGNNFAGGLDNNFNVGSISSVGIADNLTFYVAGNKEGNSVTADADFIELVDVTSGGGNNSLTTLAYDPDDTETTADVVWQDQEGSYGIIVELTGLVAAVVEGATSIIVNFL